MKLVIETVCRENYAAHNSDYVAGVSEDYWKNKGGNTYVVRNLKESHIVKINNDGIPTLRKLIEEKNEYYEEVIYMYGVVKDDAPEGEDWKAPIEFLWGGDRWLALRESAPTEYDIWPNDAALKVESWIPLEGGEEAHYECDYFDSKNRKVA